MMSNSNPRDRFFYSHIIPMIDAYNLTKLFVLHKILYCLRSLSYLNLCLILLVVSFVNMIDVNGNMIF